MMPFQGMPFAAPGYQPGYDQTIMQLLARGGDARADAAARNAAIWGRAVENIGGMVAGAVQERGDEKIRQARAAAFQDAISQFDPADPQRSFMRIASAAGPEKASSILPGLVSMFKPERRGPQDLANTVTLLKVTKDTLGEEKFAQAWAQHAPKLQEMAAEANIPFQFGAEYQPEYGQWIDNAHAQLGRKTGESGHVIEEVGPDGKRRKRLVGNEELSAGVAVAEPEPKAASYQAKDALVDGRAVQVAFDPRTGRSFMPGPDGQMADVTDRVKPIRNGVTVNMGGGDSLSKELVADIDRLPSDWRGWNASMVTRDSYPTRGNQQALAVATAGTAGKVLPWKKQGDAAIAAKSTLADISQLEKLMADPEVRKFVGAYQGQYTNFLAKGWADSFGGEAKVPAKVRQFRAALNRLGAEERHRIYGAALTNIESTYAEGFIPALDQSGATIDAALAEFKGDIERGMDAMWGTTVQGAPAPAAPTDKPFAVQAPDGKTYYFKTKAAADGFKKRAGIKG